MCYLKGVGGTCLIEDVWCETGCLAVSQVSCELAVHGRLHRIELNRRVMHGCSFEKTSSGSKMPSVYICGT